MTGLVDELEALIPFLESHHCSAEPIRKAVTSIEALVDALEVARGEVARHHASRSALPQIDAALAKVHHGGDNK